MYGLAVVLYVQPVAYVFSCSVDGDLEAFEGSDCGFGYEFFWELVGSKVVRATSNGRVESVGSVVGVDEHVCRRFRSRIWIRRTRWMLFGEGAFEYFAVDFVGGYLYEAGLFVVFSYAFQYCEGADGVALDVGCWV